MFPPPLMWVPGFCASIGRALDGGVSSTLERTVNPLVYRITFDFGEELSGKRMLLVWNIFQQYAAANRSHPQGRVEREGRKLTVTVAVERRLGPPMEEDPAV
jgi:hypothetical protein